MKFQPNLFLTGLVIETAAPDDASTIDRLARRSVYGLHHGFYDKALLTLSADMLYGADHQLLRDGSYFLVMMGDEIAAAGGWSWRRTIFGAHGPDEPATEALDPARDAARIRGFYVDPDYAGRGLGGMLLTFCEAKVRAAGFARTALTSTEPAVGFYRRHGYAQHDTFDVPLRDEMTLPLVNMDKTL